MSTKARMIVSGIVNVDEKEAYKSYVENSGSISIAKYSISKVLFGNDEIEFLAIMEFPNVEAIEAVFNSDAYKKLLPIREKGFKKLNIYIS